MSYYYYCSPQFSAEVKKGGVISLPNMSSQHSV
jgi:hypothetical protein